MQLQKIPECATANCQSLSTVTQNTAKISTHHSMAKDNLNKSKETTPTTSAALKVVP